MSFPAQALQFLPCQLSLHPLHLRNAGSTRFATNCHFQDAAADCLTYVKELLPLEAYRGSQDHVAGSQLQGAHNLLAWNH